MKAPITRPAQAESITNSPKPLREITLIQIGMDDLKWLLANTIREICIQDDEYGCKPRREDADRILRLMGDLEVDLPKEVDVSWLLDARKEVY